MRFDARGSSERGRSTATRVRSALEGFELGDESLQEAYIISCGDSVSGSSWQGRALKYFRFSWLPDSGTAAETTEKGSNSVSMTCGWLMKGLSADSTVNPPAHANPVSHQ